MPAGDAADCPDFHSHRWTDMTDPASFDQLDQAAASNGPLLEQLVALLQEQRDWHKLFDARMLKKKAELGLSLSRPPSLSDVPEEHRKAVEETYIAAAREAGQAFLAQNDIPSAWMYFQVIRDPAPVAKALDTLPDKIADFDLLDQLVQIALYSAVHPDKGVRMMLSGHGMCSTLTALDQVLPELNPADRDRCARTVVRALHEELVETLRRIIEERIPLLPPDESLESLIAGRDWLFEGGGFQIDASHLSSVVRLARSIEAPAEELELARQLAVYGSRLDRQLQYGAAAPFSDYYAAHIHFFNVLLGKQADDGLAYFRKQLDAEPDERDKPLLAFVLIDLLMRAGRLDEAVELAATYYVQFGEDGDFSFDDLCAKAGRLDVLKRVRREQGNLVGYAAALLREGSPRRHGDTEGE